MRKSEITPELIELSKRAKELGFSQNEDGFQIAEDGEWAIDTFDDELLLIDGRGGVIEEGDILILSFSRCLEWLREQGWIISHAHEYLFTTSKKAAVVFKTLDEAHYMRGEAKTHHEAIAKAVVKILEE